MIGKCSSRDIADHLGLTPETVCRTFKLMRRQGLVDRLSPTRIGLLSVPELRCIADGHEAERLLAPALGLRAVRARPMPSPGGE
jgi:hypothetical protein